MTVSASWHPLLYLFARRGGSEDEAKSCSILQAEETMINVCILIYAEKRKKFCASCEVI